MDYIIDNLVKLLKISSPTGNTTKAIEFVEEKFKSLGVQTRRTTKGALIATIEGKNTDKEVTLSGHVDTLGGMVKEIKGDRKSVV